MKLLNVPKFTSDRFTLKAENAVLWVALIIAGMVIGLQAIAYEGLKSSITPQAIYDACNRGNK